MGCHQSQKEVALHIAGPPHGHVTHVTITAESVYMWDGAIEVALGGAMETPQKG